MTAQERNKILEAISDEIRKNGPIKLGRFNIIYEGKGFSRDLYEGKGVKRFLTANFPEFEIRGAAGKELLTSKIECIQKEGK